MRFVKLDPRFCTFTRKARLTEAQVAAIRRDARPLKVIAAEYPVSMATISKIRRGETWKWVP